MLRSRKGFTLVELLVCIILVSIIAIFAITTFGVVTSLSKDNMTKQVEVITQEQEAEMKQPPVISKPKPEEQITDKGNQKRL